METTFSSKEIHPILDLLVRIDEGAEFNAADAYPLLTHIKKNNPVAWAAYVATRTGGEPFPVEIEAAEHRETVHIAPRLATDAQADVESVCTASEKGHLWVTYTESSQAEGRRVDQRCAHCAATSFFFEPPASSA